MDLKGIFQVKMPQNLALPVDGIWVIKALSTERMLNTEPITSQPRVVQKELPCLLPARWLFVCPGSAFGSLPAFCPAFVPVSSLSLHPMPASVTSYSDHTGPLPTTCPDHLPPLTSFSLSCREPVWGIPPVTRSWGRKLTCARRAQTSGAPLEIPKHVPQQKSAGFCALLFHSSDILWKKSIQGFSLLHLKECFNPKTPLMAF